MCVTVCKCIPVLKAVFYDKFDSYVSIANLNIQFIENSIWLIFPSAKIQMPNSLWVVNLKSSSLVDSWLIKISVYAVL